MKSGENVTVNVCSIPREAIPAFTERIVRHGYAAPAPGKPPDRKTHAICRDHTAAMQKTEADTRSLMRVTYEAGPQGPFVRLPRERQEFKEEGKP